MNRVSPTVLPNHDSFVNKLSFVPHGENVHNAIPNLPVGECLKDFVKPEHPRVPAQ